MGVEAALLWLLEVVGKKKIGDLLTARPTRELQTLGRALEESHNVRDDLLDTARLLTDVALQRDSLQLQVFELRLENQKLRDEPAAARG